MRTTFKQILFRTIGVGLILLSACALWFIWQIKQPFSNFSSSAAESKLSFKADVAALKRHVKILSQDLAPRPFDNLTQLNKSAYYISGEFKKLGLNVKEQTYDVEGKTYKNLIVSFEPVSTVSSREIIVVGAHYDTAGDHPGADDNASGVAGLLELARLLKSDKLTQRVELVAYTLEEPPYFRTPQMGSAVHAASLKKDNVKVSFMISLECIGYFSDAPNSQEFPLPALSLLYPSTGNYLALIGRMKDSELTRHLKAQMQTGSKLPIYSINAPTFVQGIDFSDHLNYWKEGYPAFMVTDTAFYRNKAYHTDEDTEDKLDYIRMGQAVEAVHAAIWQQASTKATF